MKQTTKPKGLSDIITILGVSKAKERKILNRIEEKIYESELDNIFRRAKV